MDFFADIVGRDFSLGIITGLLCTLIVYLAKKFFCFLRRSIASLRFINVYTKSKILNVYDNQDLAESQMLIDAKSSDKNLIFCIRGQSFSENTKPLHELLISDNRDAKIIIADPNSDFVKRRIRELNNFPLIEQILSSAKSIEEMQKKNSRIELKYHAGELRTRFYIFDNVMYLGYVLNGVPGRKAQMLRIGSSSVMYKSCEEQFYDVWNNN